MADAVVLAGDIDRGTRGLVWAAERFQDSDLIYIPGNHEYHSGAIPALTLKLRTEAKRLGARVHFLDREAVQLKGVRFIGVTLWTDFAIAGDPKTAIAAAAHQMNDYRSIRVSPSYRRLQPKDTKLYHLRDKRWLQNELMAASTHETVVVTHHAPSGQSLSRGFAAEPIDAAYASQLDDLVATSKALLWIHGHTHTSADYVIGSTRVVSNPRGYPGLTEVAGYRPDLVVEL